MPTSSNPVTSVLPAKCPLAGPGPYTVWSCDFGYTVLDAKGYNALRIGGHAFTDKETAEKVAASWN